MNKCKGSYIINKYVTAIFFVFVSGTCHASELMSSADVLESKQWALSVYGRGVSLKPTVKVTSQGAIQVPVAGGNVSLFSTTDAEIRMDQTYESQVVAIRFRPFDGLTYRINAGAVENFELSYSSGDHTNSLESTRSGLVWGIGAEWNVSPGTIVTPAISLDGSFSQTRISLDRFQSPGVSSPSSNRIVQNQVQFALNASKRFNRVEPFGGLKMIRTITKLKNSATKEQIQGTRDGVSPFIGLQVEFFPGEMLVLEGSIVEEKAFNAGLKIKF